MDNSEIRIFYSWQSDLPSSQTRGLIQSSIDAAVGLLRNTVAIEADRDTKGEFGSPDINQTIFAKIDECDIFIADISIINKYHAIDNEGNPIEDVKLTPNPNVLLELGYAAHVVGWHNVICIMNTDYGLPTDLPFDLEHRRPTQYSLKNTEKADVRKYLRGIIADHVVNLLENGKRVKAKFSDIRVGSYQVANKEISKTLIPWNPIEAPRFLAVKKSILEECQKLIGQINCIHLVNPQELAEMASGEQRMLQQLEIPKEDIQSFLGLLSQQKSPVKINEEDRRHISELVKFYFNIDITEDFFYFGSLHRPLSILGMETSELGGTPEEIDKYENFMVLKEKLYKLEIRDRYLETFDGLILLPLAVKNDSIVADDDISITLRINTKNAETIVPDKELFNPEIKGLEGLIYDDGIISIALKMEETSSIQYDEVTNTDDAFSGIYPPKIKFDFTGGYICEPEHNSQDYARELAEYIATPRDASNSEYDFYISSLRAKEIKWLDTAILLKPKSTRIEIAYSIKSRHSDGSLSGMLIYNAE